MRNKAVDAHRRAEEAALAERMEGDRAEQARRSAAMKARRDVQIAAQSERMQARRDETAAARKLRSERRGRRDVPSLDQLNDDVPAARGARRGRGGGRGRRVPMKRPTNRRTVRNAIVWVCLAGEHLKEQRNPVLKAVDRCDPTANLVVLFGSNKRLTFRGAFLLSRDIYFSPLSLSFFLSFSLSFSLSLSLSLSLSCLRART